MARKTLTGSSGAGIVVVRQDEKPDNLPQAPLYTRLFPKTHEFRAHIWKGKLIDFTQKKFKSGADNAEGSRFIRSLDNGWIHAHDNISLAKSDIERIGKASAECVRILGLDFGAVDILAILHKGEGQRKLKEFRICEVNTAPGLENTATIQAYRKAVENIS